MKGVIFTYGDKIYAPNIAEISPALKIHESIHSQQQGGHPDGWWMRYIEDAKFRYEEELAAHRAEYEYYDSHPRKIRRLQLKFISKRLSSPLYGQMISTSKAKDAIKNG